MNEKKGFSVTGHMLATIFTGSAIALVYVLLQHFEGVRTVLANILNILSPITGGLITAYLLNMLMSALERGAIGKIKKHGLMRAVSLLLTVIIALLVIAGLFFAIIPQSISSIATLAVSVQQFITDSRDDIEALAAKLEFGEDIVNTLYGSWSDTFTLMKDKIMQTLPTLLETIKSVGSGVVSGIVNAIISFIIAIYVLADKENLCKHTHMLLRAVLSEKKYNTVIRVARRTHHIFSGFIGGKLLDSLIIGIICFICMLLFKWPYALLISVIVGVTNVIPTFGPVIGAIPGTLILAIESPIQALWFLVFIIILQQFDGNLLGPMILGDSTGLSAFWVLIAITLFGAFWGVAGMIVGVPLVATIYTFVGEFVDARLAEQNVDIDELTRPEEPSAHRKSFTGIKTLLAKIKGGDKGQDGDTKTEE